MTSNASSQHVAVVGLGYVGLPLAVALARTTRTTGFDTDEQRVNELLKGHDRTGELSSDELSGSSLKVTTHPDDCFGADIFIVTVPTPVDGANRPDLRPLTSATELVGRLLVPNKTSLVVYESTVYPGVTEEVCGPLIEAVSGLRRGSDFMLGYSPERINPGDREHSIDKIVKVVAGENTEATERLAALYGQVTSAGTFKAKSIKAAEAAKVIENAQRDINVAFMNEITQIFDKLGLSVLDVLDAARTKWNFLPFQPGLVGGHCIGVDPYYLSHCAQSLGHLPRVILAGRSINDNMGTWVADTLHTKRESRTGTVLILGVTFKEDVPDLRNSKVFDVVQRLSWLGHEVTVHDPLADPVQTRSLYGLDLDAEALERQYDVVLFAVPHQSYKAMDAARVERLVASDGLLADLYGTWRGRTSIPSSRIWSL